MRGRLATQIEHPFRAALGAGATANATVSHDRPATPTVPPDRATTASDAAAQPAPETVPDAPGAAAGGAPSRRYMPVLRARPADLDALAALTGPVRAAITPLLDVPPPDLDPVTQLPRRPVNAVLAERLAHLVSAWPDPTPPRVDFRLIEAFVQQNGPQHTFGWFLDEARAAGRSIVPVTAVGRSALYRAAVRDAARQDGYGLALRLPGAALTDPAAVAAFLRAELTFYGVAPRDVDLIVDYGALHRRRQGPLVAPQWLGTLRTIPARTRWRSLTVTASSIPFGLSNVQALKLTGGAQTAEASLPRIEWAAWLALRGLYASLPPGSYRMPDFGDYAILHPAFRPADPRVLKSVAQIRYATPHAWIISRGQQVNAGGAAQYRPMARALVARPDFAGAAFSAGDQYVDDVAAGRMPPGAPKRWTEAGTVHHITQTVRQIATLPPGP